MDFQNVYGIPDLNEEFMIHDDMIEEAPIPKFIKQDIKPWQTYAGLKIGKLRIEKNKSEMPQKSIKEFSKEFLISHQELTEMDIDDVYGTDDADLSIYQDINVRLSFNKIEAHQYNDDGPPIQEEIIVFKPIFKVPAKYEYVKITYLIFMKGKKNKRINLGASNSKSNTYDDGRQFGSGPHGNNSYYLKLSSFNDHVDKDKNVKIVLKICQQDQ